MRPGSTYNVLKELGIKGLVLVSCVIVGLILILIVPTFPMKLLGIGVVILSFLGLIISFYQRGFVTGKEFIVEGKKPSTPLPKNLKVDEIQTDKGKIISFENIDTDQPEDFEEDKKKKRKKKNVLVQGFINFVTRSDEKPYFPEEKKSKNKNLDTNKEIDSSLETTQLDDTEGSFKILRKSKSNKTTADVPPSVKEEKVVDERQGDVQQEIDIEKKGHDKISAEPSLKDEEIVKIELPSDGKEILQEPALNETIVFEEDIENKIPTFKNRFVEVKLEDTFAEDNLIKGEPIKEMKILFQRLLNVIGTVTKTTTSAFYLVNKAKNELVLQAIVSHNQNSLRKDRKLPLGGDLVSQIVQRGKPEIIDFNIPSAELDLLPYYETPVGARTFIGVPLTMRNSIIGVLCADSSSPEAFDNYTMNFFLHYSKIFSFFLESYTEKYELLLESQVLGLVDELRKGYFVGGSKFVESVKNIIGSILNLFDFLTVGICLYDFDAKYYRIYYIRSKKNLDTDLKNKKVDLKRTLLGKALSERRILNVDFDEHKQRVHYTETKLKRGNFLAIPIKTQSGVYGSLFGWTEDLNPILNSTVRVLEDVAFALGLFYENDYLNFVMQIQTKTDTKGEKDNFVRRVEEEWARAVEFGIPFSICKIAIDNYILDSSLISEFEIQSRKVVIDSLRKVVNQFDFFCELEDKTIGVILIGRSGKDAKLLFEMLRKNIAQTMLKIQDENVFFTISVGIAQFSKDTNFSKLIENVEKALDISCSRKNTVTLY